MIQNGKPIAFYSWKINLAQISYTTTEWQLLITVENLKESPTILLGHCIPVSTDHKKPHIWELHNRNIDKLTPKFGEIRHDIKYIRVPGNDAADALSRLPLIKYDVKESEITRGNLVERYGVDKLDSGTFPLKYRTIDKY